MSALSVALVTGLSLSLSIASGPGVGEEPVANVSSTVGASSASVGNEFASPCTPMAPPGVEPAPTSLPGRHVLVGYSQDGTPSYQQVPEFMVIAGCDDDGAPILVEAPGDSKDPGPCEWLGVLCPERW